MDLFDEGTAQSMPHDDDDDDEAAAAAGQMVLFDDIDNMDDLPEFGDAADAADDELSDSSAMMEEGELADHEQVETHEIEAMLPYDYVEDVPLQDVVILTPHPEHPFVPLVMELNEKMKLPPELRCYHRSRTDTQIILLTVEQVIDEIYNPNGDFHRLLTREFRLARSRGQHPVYEEPPTRAERAEIMRRHSINFYHFHRMVFLYMAERKVSHGIINYIILDETALHVCQMAARMPRMRWQYNNLAHVWPCNFIIYTYAEELYNKLVYTDEQDNFHRLVMHVLTFVRDLCDVDCCVAVDPRTRRIVAMGIELVYDGVKVHCARVLMEAMARYRGFGEWPDDVRRVEAPDLPSLNAEDFDDPGLLCDGVDLSWRDYIRRYIEIEFGAEPCMDPFDVPTMCRGFDIYMTREPCMDCAQFMISRHVQSVFFEYENMRDVTRQLCYLNRYDPERLSFIAHQIT